MLEEAQEYQGLKLPSSVTPLLQPPASYIITCHAFRSPPRPGSWPLSKHLPTLSLQESGLCPITNRPATVNLDRFYYQLKPRPSISCDFEYYILDNQTSHQEPTLPAWPFMTPSFLPSPAQGKDISTPHSWTCSHQPTNFLDVTPGAICLSLHSPQTTGCIYLPKLFLFSNEEQSLMGQCALLWLSCLPLKTCPFPLVLTFPHDLIFSLDEKRSLFWVPESLQLPDLASKNTEGLSILKFKRSNK